MLEYPSILGWRKMPEAIDEPCYAFTKYDGSNLRWEWSPKQGWYKFGTRHQLFDAKTLMYGQAVPLFLGQMGDTIANLVKEFYGKKVERITAFTEFYGDNSFAGVHDLNDRKSLRLFDVSVFKKGFASPKDFYEIFGEQDWCAHLEYKGPMSMDFIEDIRKGAPINEGVVCKGGEGHNIWRTKVKSLAYLERLRQSYPKLYDEDKDVQ